MVSPVLSALCMSVQLILLMERIKFRENKLLAWVIR